MNNQASTSKEKLIEISLVQGEAYVWSAASVALLRRNYGIVGMLTGSLPLIPQQNAFLGVPLQLFEEEVVYLLRRGAVVLVDDTKAHGVEAFSGTDLDQWHEQRIASILDRRRKAIDEARETKEKLKKQFAMSESALQKKRLREERKRLQGGEQDKEEDLFAKSEPAKSEPAKSEPAKSEPAEEIDEETANQAFAVAIPSSSSTLQWHNVILGENSFSTLSSAAKAGLWRYPATANQRARCATFEALRAKGYYMGKGLRFGGDFVVYPGDPLRYHSHFTATVQTTPQSLISAHELIAAGRLGTAVKKAHVLCSVKGALQESEEVAWQRTLDGENDYSDKAWGDVDFISLTWAGFGI